MRNGTPKMVIMYRDGVSDSQFDTIIMNEVPKIEEAIEKVFGKVIGLSVVIVTKRIHTEFFGKGEAVNETGNIRCGTVVDKDVVNADMNNFYMYSYNAILVN